MGTFPLSHVIICVCVCLQGVVSFQPQGAQIATQAGCCEDMRQVGLKYGEGGVQWTLTSSENK